MSKRSTEAGTVFVNGFNLGPAERDRKTGNIEMGPQVTQRAIQAAKAALDAHMKRHAGQLLTRGTFASDEFDRLYIEWIRLRWDAGEPWTRNVWKARP